MASSDNKIVLESSDGATFEVTEPVARELQIVANAIDDDCADKAIPLANVTGDVLAKILEFCKKHVEEENAAKVEQEDVHKVTCKEWEAEFMKQFDIKFLFQLTVAANYLNIKGLLDLTCQTIADHIKDKSPEEVREIFGIVNDFTEEEEAEVRRANEWAFENPEVPKEKAEVSKENPEVPKEKAEVPKEKAEVSKENE